MAGKKDIWSLMSGAVISLTFATSAMADAPLSKEAPKATIQSPEENLRKKRKPFNKLIKNVACKNQDAVNRQVGLRQADKKLKKICDPKTPDPQ